MFEFSVQTNNYLKITEILLDQALHGERKRLMELLLYLLKHAISMSTIGDEIIRPAMVENGDMWASGKLKINEENIKVYRVLFF